MAPDPQFFHPSSPLTLREIAEKTGAALAQGSDAEYRIGDIAPLDTAKAHQLSFFENAKYKAQFLSTKAGACIIHEKDEGAAPPGMNLLISKNPYKSYALAAALFYPLDNGAPFISEHAHIAPTAILGKNCTIEAGAVIKAGAKLGDDCRIGANASIGRNVQIGARTRIGDCASLSHALIGENVNIYPGVRIGQDGFGFAPDAAGFIKVPQLGRVLISDHVEIGANSTIDRGSAGDTVIGEGTWIDNQVQIGHNVKIGRQCIIVSMVGVSGSTEIGDYCVIGGQAGLAGHLKIGKGAKIAAQAGVLKDVPAGESYMGYPARPMRAFLKQMAVLNRLVKRDKTS